MSKRDVEEGSVLAVAFDRDGLAPAVATDVVTGEVLMLAWMNAEALNRTIETGEAWYWSRSRRELWHKGATSGQIQHVQELRVDCDGGCCHTGRTSCFYRMVVNGSEGPVLRRGEPAASSAFLRNLGLAPGRRKAMQPS